MTPRLKKLYKFTEEIEKLKLVERAASLSNLKRKESDAEHMWHLALMAILLEKDFGFKFDALKALKMVLVHDLPEIYAGDIFLFDEKGKMSKEALEKKAAKKLFGMLPSDLAKEFHKLFNEYNDGKTPEARAAIILDTIQGCIQVLLSGGKVLTDNKITMAQFKKARKEELELMKNTPMYEVMMHILKEAKQKGYLS